MQSPLPVLPRFVPTPASGLPSSRSLDVFEYSKYSLLPRPSSLLPQPSSSLGVPFSLPERPVEDAKQHHIWLMLQQLHKPKFLVLFSFYINRLIINGLPNSGSHCCIHHFLLLVGICDLRIHKGTSIKDVHKNVRCFYRPPLSANSRNLPY